MQAVEQGEWAFDYSVLLPMYGRYEAEILRRVLHDLEVLQLVLGILDPATIITNQQPHAHWNPQAYAFSPSLGP